MDVPGELAAGRLGELLSSGAAAVRDDPTDTDARYRYFAFLCFAGELHKARKQLSAMDVGDPAMSQVLGVYINLLASAQERVAVFHHGAEPLLPPDPPVGLAKRLEALAAAGAGDEARAVELIEEAGAAAVAGKLNGVDFTSIEDQDEFLGPVLEIYAGGRYLWLPFEDIARLEVDPPRHLLDLLWLPARLYDQEGSESLVHLPVVYDGSHDAADPRAVTGHVTEWNCDGTGCFRGRGQRLLGWRGPEGAEQDLPLLELRTLEIPGDD